MGYKKIQEKRKELSAQTDARRTFMEAAQNLDDVLSNVEKTRQQVSQKLSTLKTCGVPEFEAYKSELVACLGRLDAAKPPSLEPISRFAANASRDLDRMIQDYENKLAAACPKDVKPGMTFKDTHYGRIYEVTKGPMQATNENLKGDAAIWFDGNFYKDGSKTGSCEMSLAELKKYKYLRT